MARQGVLGQCARGVNKKAAMSLAAFLFVLKFSKKVLTKNKRSLIIKTQKTNKCSQAEQIRCIKGGIYMRIANVRKFIRSILIIMVTILCFTLFINKSTLSHGETEYKTIYVSEGDTLWNIAKSNQKNNGYYKDKDVRYIINDLIKINNLNTSTVNVNQELKIPQI